MPLGKRDYAAEYREYHSKLDQKKNRAKRNAARVRRAAVAGLHHAGASAGGDHVLAAAGGDRAFRHRPREAARLFVIA